MRRFFHRLRIKQNNRAQHNTTGNAISRMSRVNSPGLRTRQLQNPPQEGGRGDAVTLALGVGVGVLVLFV